MKILMLITPGLLLFSTTFSYSDVNVPCLAEYTAASEGLYTASADIIPYNDLEQKEALLSYRGPRLISYEGPFEFNTYKGKLELNLREVTREKTLSKEGAALVAELIAFGHDDSDWAVVQYMSLELRNAFPKIMMDQVVYHILSRDMAQDMFCKNKLWTWRAIRKWMKETAVPRYLKENPDTDISETPICRKLPKGGADCSPK